MNNQAQPEPSGSAVSRRDFLKGGIAAGVVAGGSLGAFYFGYASSLSDPVRVGVLGTGDEGSVLIGAINPEFIEVKAIADIRPYNVWRAFHGDHYSEAAEKARPGLLKVFGWNSETEASRHVKVYGDYRELIANARADGLEAVIIALPLHLHAPAAIAAMQAGLHVMTEKLMGHSVHECKEMALVAAKTGRYLAVGHQRHYNILYHEAEELIRRGALGEVHYIRAQWHRGNLPGKDSWQQPLPPEVRPEDPRRDELIKKRDSWRKRLEAARGSEIDVWRTRVAQVEAQLADRVLAEQIENGRTRAEQFDYQGGTLLDAAGDVVYRYPAAEELIRWRLWDRTGGGLMAELGSHQLDAASIFVGAAHGGKKQLPLTVMAAAARPVFPRDRDVESHVFCILEFPAPGYDPKDPIARRKRIGVQYASVNGNGFGGYGEIVFGTEGTLILAREQELIPPEKPDTKVSVEAGPTMDTQASGPQQQLAQGEARQVSRGYREELEHWAWCIRNPGPENQPRCHPRVALADAVIALTANIAAREGRRIAFDPAWFDPTRKETPEGVVPDVSRYKPVG